MASKVPPICFAVALGLGGLGLLSTANAINYDWNGSVDNDWLNGANWTPTGPPMGGSGNNAFVNNGGTARISADVLPVQDWFIGRGPGTSGTLQHTAGTGTVTGWIFVGSDGGTGTYNLTGPGNTLGSGSLNTGRLYVGGQRDLNGGTGIMNVNTSGTLTLTSDLAVGARGGTGTLNITDGNIVARSWVIIGETHNGAGGAVGTVVQNGGVFTAGATEPDARFWLGSQETAVTGPASSGTYTINGGSFSARNAIIGRTYTGTFNQNGGSVTLNTATGAAENRLGEAAGSTGNYNLTNGTFTLGGTFQVGVNGTGNFVQSGGTVNASLRLDVGVNSGSVGNFNMTAGTYTQTAADPANEATWNQIATNGGSTADFRISGGTLSFDSRTFLGRHGNATITQTGGVLEVRRGEVNIADTGTAVYNLSGGTFRTLNAASLVTVGQWDNGSGTLNVSATGFADIAGDLVVGAGQNPAPTTGVVNQNGGTVKVGDELVLGASILANGTYNLSGGKLDLTGGVLRKGAGTGAFAFTGGRLEDAATISFALLQQGGTLAPGAAGSTGTTTVNGDYSLLAGGTLELSIVNPTTFDAVTVNGSVSLSGNLTLVDTVGTLPQNSSFVILQNDAADPVIGFFANAPHGVTFTQGGNAYTVFYNAGDGNDIVLVPEPGTAVAILGGLGLLVGARRRSF